MIHLIQIGERLTGQKEEINNLVWATGGKSILINDGSDILREINYLAQNCIVAESIYSDSALSSEYQKLITFVSNLEKISQIKNEESRLRVARDMSQQAVYKKFLDPFNSMIAIETSWQAQQLEDLSKDKDAYDKDYNIGDKSLLAPNMMMGSSMPEVEEYITILIMALIFISFVIVRKNNPKSKCLN